MDTGRHPIGSLGREAGLSPRMLRYLEDHGVVAPDRGPQGTGHRHFPPPEARIAVAAASAMRDGHAVGTLQAVRGLAAARVASVVEGGGPLAWFELVALAREVELAAIAREPAPPPPPPPPHPPAPGEEGR